MFDGSNHEYKEVQQNDKVSNKLRLNIKK